jgi:uncharacterized membrane protein YbhN (UPF0104 family)
MRLPRSVRRFVRVLAVAVVVEYLLIPQLAGTRKSWHLLLDVDNVWLLVALALEVGSLLAYALLTWTLLPQNARPTYGRVLRIDLSTLAVSHSVPAGSAVGLGMGYRMLTAAGVAPAAAVAAKATQAVGSAVVLNTLLGAALITSIALHGYSSVYGLVAIAGLIALSLAAAIAIILTRHEQRTSEWLGRALGRLPFVSAGAVRSAVNSAASICEDSPPTGGCWAESSSSRWRTGCWTPAPYGRVCGLSGTRLGPTGCKMCWQLSRSRRRGWGSSKRS